MCAAFCFGGWCTCEFVGSMNVWRWPCKQVVVVVGRVSVCVHVCESVRECDSESVIHRAINSSS